MGRKKLVSIGLIVLGGILLFQWRFWLKLVGLGLIGLGIFWLVRGKKQSEGEDAPVYREEDEALSRDIRKLQRTIRLLKVLFVIGCIATGCTIISVAFGGSVVPLIVVAILSAIVKAVQESYESKLKTYVSDNITRQALESVFQITEYQPFGAISHRLIEGSNFGISSFDDIHGSDYVKGFYRGLPIEMCDIQLTSRETRTDEDGNTEEYDQEVFKGFWLICDFGKELSADMRLWERGKMGKLFGGKGIQTENEQFNKHFHVESEVEVEAFYILTPHMMEYILEMDRKASGETHMRFDRNGKVQIAIRREHDAFEVGRRRKDAALLRQQFIQEIRYITDLIDELRLVDTLYKK